MHNLRFDLQKRVFFLIQLTDCLYELILSKDHSLPDLPLGVQGNAYYLFGNSRFRRLP